MPDLAKTISEKFPQKTVVIVGDLVADQFLNGTISRVSREAPVFILRHDETVTLPGAAANAAANVASLGGRSILIGIVGDDQNRKLLGQSLDAKGVDRSHAVVDPGFTTTTKVRVLAGQHYAARQQVIRIDYENKADVSAETKAALRRNLEAVSGEADAIIISDYGCGSVFPEIVEDARRISKTRGIPLIVDSRYDLEGLAGSTTATPNREEVEQIVGRNFTAADCADLRRKLGLEALLVTNGNQGMMLFEGDMPPLNMPVVGSAEPVDVTGAGDTVIAAYALSLASGLGFAAAARVANHAGGIVVMKKGTACVTACELLDSLAAEPSPLAISNAESK